MAWAKTTIFHAWMISSTLFFGWGVVSFLISDKPLTRVGVGVFVYSMIFFLIYAFGYLCVLEWKKIQRQKASRQGD